MSGEAPGSAISARSSRSAPTRRARGRISAIMPQVDQRASSPIGIGEGRSTASRRRKATSAAARRCSRPRASGGASGRRHGAGLPLRPPSLGNDSLAGQRGTSLGLRRGSLRRNPCRPELSMRPDRSLPPSAGDVHAWRARRSGRAEESDRERGALLGKDGDRGRGVRRRVAPRRRASAEEPPQPTPVAQPTRVPLPATAGRSSSLRGGCRNTVGGALLMTVLGPDEIQKHRSASTSRSAASGVVAQSTKPPRICASRSAASGTRASFSVARSG